MSYTNRDKLQYNDHRDSILRGPDYTYRFHLSILGVNQQIRAEALDLHLREHTFISITHHRSTESPVYGSEGPHCGIAVLAQGDQARTFPNIGMYIDFNAVGQPSVSASGELQKRVVSVLLIDVLAAACVTLQRIINFHQDAFSISITISSSIGNHPGPPEGGSPIPCSPQRKCLDAMSKIRGAGRVEIHGPVDDSYRAATIRAMCSRNVSLEETMALVGVQTDQGDKALAKGKLESAIAEYRAAFHTLRSTPFPRNAREEFDQVLIRGRFRGVTVGW